MRNPWLAKNPFMSAWLSSANRVAGSARAQATAAAKREVTSLQATATQQMIDFWTGKPPAKVARATPATPAPAPARKRKKKR